MFHKIIKFLGLLFFTLFITGCSPSEEQVVGSLDEVPSAASFAARNVNYYAERPETEGYLVMPEADGPQPAIILIHEWWGLNDDIRRKAEEFAAEGYVALAVDLYEGQFGSTPDEARSLASGVRENVDEAFNNLGAAVDYLKALPQVDSEKLASVGWCFGGQWSYEMAKNDLGSMVSIMYYGRFHPEDDLSKMRAKIIGHFAEDDLSIKVDDVRLFQSTLATHSGDHEIYIYENAGHAFANNDSEAYVEEAAEEAWARSLRFLDQHLK